MNYRVFGKTLVGFFLIATVMSFSPVSPFNSKRGLFSSVYAATVNGITVRGNTRIDDESVRSYLTFSSARQASTFEIAESIKQLYATGIFRDVKINRRGGGIVVDVVENPIIHAVVFEGNDKLDDDVLASIVLSKPRSYYNKSKVERDVQRLLEVYRRSGRFGAKVDPKIINLEKGRVNLVYEVTEGNKSGIESITFIGNKSFSDRRLRRVISTRESGILSFLRSGDTYDPDRLNADQEALRRFYYKNGYADFEIISSVVDFDQKGNRFLISFTIEEGEQYRFGEVTMESTVSEVSVDPLYSHVLTEKGDVYNAADVEKTVENLTIAIAESGYAFADVVPRGTRNYEDRTISVSYVIQGGARVYVEKINITGNLRTRDYVIRREFDLAEGDAYNRALVAKAERRLRELDFFEKIEIEARQGSSPDKVVLDVQVTEKGTGNLAFSAGYSTSDGIIGDISLTERNFLGRGQSLRVSVGGGEDSRNYQLGFTEPYFMGYNFAAGFNVYNRSFEDNNNRSYDYQNTGGEVFLRFPITDDLKFRVGYELSSREISNAAAGSSLAILDAVNEGEITTSKGSLSLTYSTINSFRDPTDGYYLKLVQEVAGLGGDVNFLRTTADARSYHELYPEWNVIGILKGKAGYVTAWNDDTLRLLDGFIRGGETIRGFRGSGFGPREVGGNNEALPAKIYYAATAEIQAPLPFIPEELGIRLAGFTDVGSAFDTDVDEDFSLDVFDDRSLRGSVGGSVMWDSPLGNLRFDAAHVYAKEDYDRTRVIRFSIGSEF